MSLGYGGWCYIAVQDEQTVIYQYGSYNLNDSTYCNAERVCDGTITIDKESLVEPEIHEKLKRFPNGKKKLMVKRIVKDVPYKNLFENGKIQIQNSKNCWQKSVDGNDYIAWHLIWNIFSEYQKNGIIPDKMSYNV